ncbi:hypothetical protein [Brucella anthropi]|uniref:hypothetical protein n=1 Tax=Brucella anthropi TaxID=529 RepID=UPI00215839CB|nr:hypothetical protein [Brucella anthropi]MCR8493703.1 hypothetical protein [Brucella anthropi]
MSKFSYVVVEQANSQFPIEVHEASKHWQALEYIAVRYVDEELASLSVDVAIKLPDGSLDFDC